MPAAIPQADLDQLFHSARTHNRWTDEPVDAALLEKAYELAALGPTSMNTQPARFIFIKSAAAKARLLPTLSLGNVDKTKAAPVTVL